MHGEIEVCTSHQRNGELLAEKACNKEKLSPQTTDDIKMWQEQKSGTQGTTECITDVLTTF